MWLDPLLICLFACWKPKLGADEGRMYEQLGPLEYKMK
jgi:hypothetical protein